MIGDELITKHFGTYIERKDTTTPAVEFVGVVAVRERNGIRAAYLWADNKRYDLPRFMLLYEGRTVAILGRVYTKQVADKLYTKIVVISAKPIQ